MAVEIHYYFASSKLGVREITNSMEQRSVFRS